MAEYHPNYFGGHGRSHRQDCDHRLRLLLPHVRGRMLDVGCSGGFYSFGLAPAAELVLAIDSDQEAIIACRQIQEQHLDRAGNIVFAHLDLDTFLLSFPRLTFDTVLYLSVHHHLIADVGMERADQLLGALIGRSRRLLFDMGQKNEKKCESYGWWKALPAEEPESWMRLKLSGLGRHVSPIGSSIVHGVQRILWMVF